VWEKSHDESCDELKIDDDIIKVYITENFPQSYDNVTWLADTATFNTTTPIQLSTASAVSVTLSEIHPRHTWECCIGCAPSQCLYMGSWSGFTQTSLRTAHQEATDMPKPYILRLIARAFKITLCYTLILFSATSPPLSSHLLGSPKVMVTVSPTSQISPQLLLTSQVSRKLCTPLHIPHPLPLPTLSHLIYLIPL